MKSLGLTESRAQPNMSTDEQFYRFLIFNSENAVVNDHLFYMEKPALHFDNKSGFGPKFEVHRD